MKLPVLFFLLLGSQMMANAQEPLPVALDYYMRPTNSVPRYIAYTEKKDTGWYRETFYWPEKSLAATGWYLDSAGKTPHGPQQNYHRNRFLKSSGYYRHGKQQGPWLQYSRTGMLTDSINYSSGKKRGNSYSYHESGYLADSTFFDEAGNGTQITWYDDGAPASTGAWVSDTAMSKRWTYFYKSGKVQATEDYVNGELVRAVCYDSTGAISTLPCEGREAVFSEDESAWIKFLMRHLKPDVPVKAGAPLGMYTVAIEFVVNKDGTLSDMQPVTSFGYGMEQEVMRLLRKSPKWVPALQHGLRVRAYRVQPVTFEVTAE